MLTYTKKSDIINLVDFYSNSILTNLLKQGFMPKTKGHRRMSFFFLATEKYYIGEIMGFRVILLENELTVRMKLNNLIICKDEKDIWIPLDDISILVIDNLKITVSTRVLCSLAQHNIGLVICDQEHLPIGFYSSYDNHSRISKMIKYQIDFGKNNYEKLWKSIIIAKIANQRKVLDKLNKSREVIGQILQMEKEVDVGDVSNREAHAAKLYFNELMECTFSRGNEDILLNSGLDYGYTIIRSYIARLCVGYGLNCQLGIHHKNEFNRFNLADDIIEVFRPYVDYYAYKLLWGEKYFTGEHRRKLINILNHKVKYREKNMFFSNVLEEYVSNIASIISNRTNNVVYPDIDGYQGE